MREFLIQHMKAIFMVVHSFKSWALTSVNTLPRAILQCLLNFIELIINLDDKPNWFLLKHYIGRHLYLVEAQLHFQDLQHFICHLSLNLLQ